MKAMKTSLKTLPLPSFSAMLPRFRSGLDTPRTYLEHCIGTITAREPKVHAFRTLALDAARAAYPDRRIVALFQPHLYSRTRDFAGEFGQALATGADVVALTDIYQAREQPIPGVTADLIARAAARAGHAPDWFGLRADATAALIALVQPGDLVLTMGAGDVTQVGPELLAALGAGAA